MKKIMSMEEVEIFFLKKFNLWPPVGSGDYRCASTRLAEHHCFGGFRGDRDAFSHSLRLLVPNWPKSANRPDEITGLEGVRLNKNHPLFLYGKFIHRVLRKWDSLVKEAGNDQG